MSPKFDQLKLYLFYIDSSRLLGLCKPEDNTLGLPFIIEVEAP